MSEEPWGGSIPAIELVVRGVRGAGGDTWHPTSATAVVRACLLGCRRACRVLLAGRLAAALLVSLTAAAATPAPLHCGPTRPTPNLRCPPGPARPHALLRSWLLSRTHATVGWTFSHTTLMPAACCPALMPGARSWLLSHTHVVVGWMFNISFSLALVYASTWLVRWGQRRCWGPCRRSTRSLRRSGHGRARELAARAAGAGASLPLPPGPTAGPRCCPQVVNVAPEAGGAGVAEVMAYLNGCFMPKVMVGLTAPV